MASSNYPFAYLSAIVGLVLVMYLIILLFFLTIRRTRMHESNIIRYNNPEIPRSIYDDSSYLYELTTKFELVISSIFGRGFKFLFFITRFLSALFFLIYALIFQGQKYGQESFFHFTNWNSISCFIYFSLACISSIIGIYTSRTRSSFDRMLDAQADWSFSTVVLGTTVHLGFEILGATTIFTLILDLVYMTNNTTNRLSLQDNKNYNQINLIHILTIIIILIEFIQNKLEIRFDQFPAVISWFIIYLLILWPSVFTGLIPNWPYNILQSKQKSCFLNYFFLFLLNFACFFLWYIIYKIKIACGNFREYWDYLKDYFNTGNGSADSDSVGDNANDNDDQSFVGSYAQGKTNRQNNNNPAQNSDIAFNYFDNDNRSELRHVGKTNPNDQYNYNTHHDDNVELTLPPISGAQRRRNNHTSTEDELNSFVIGLNNDRDFK
eukprot:gene13668-18341_t